jgi:hypothetical protein
MDLDSNERCAFIIAHKYFRGHASYLKFYIENIQKFYPKALTIVVDNNSAFKEDVFSTIENTERVVFLDNNIESKFEIGAYCVGIQYIIDNDLANNFDYITMTQDTFVLKNKFDFNSLSKLNVTACPINSWHYDWYLQHISEHVLSMLGLNNNYDKITFCWCNSFVVSTSKLTQLFDYLKRIVIRLSIEREASERYLARILWELNDFKNNDIDGNIDELKQHYNCHTVDIVNDNISTHFVKRPHQKTEHTKDS